MISATARDTIRSMNSNKIIVRHFKKYFEKLLIGRLIENRARAGSVKAELTKTILKPVDTTVESITGN